MYVNDDLSAEDSPTRGTDWSAGALDFSNKQPEVLSDTLYPRDLFDREREAAGGTGAAHGTVVLCPPWIARCFTNG
jgi:hypothetical protein